MINPLFKLFSARGRIESCRTRLYQAAYAWCHDRALAEDLVQETLLKAIASKSGLQNPKYLDTWLFRILINSWHDYLKSKKAIENFEDYVFQSINDVEKEYLSGELITRVRQEVSKLPIMLREVITLSDFSGFSYQQIADIMAIPVGTVMSRLYRARRKLEKALLDTQSAGEGVTYLRKVQ
jgi:RNA polymerase sigma-70 factor (ECF subfamily)